jgi:hypothetical protein
VTENSNYDSERNGMEIKEKKKDIFKKLYDYLKI